MLVAGGDGGPVRGPGRFLGGGVLVFVGPVAELAVEIAAPGPEATVVLDGYGVVITCGNGRPCVQSYLDGSARAVAGPVAELAFGIAAPGPEGAVRLEGDSMIPTCGNGGPVGRTGRFLGGNSLVGRCSQSSNPVAEPAVFIEAPGPERAVRPPGNRMSRTRGDGGPVGGSGRFLGGGVPLCGGPVSELAVAIPAPGQESGSIVREDERGGFVVS